MSKSLAPGQVWLYQTRPGESESRLTIVGIDYDDEEYGDIVHVYLSGLEIDNPSAPGGKTLFIAHLPYVSAALEESLVQLESQHEDMASALSDYESTQEAYRLWKKAFENSEAGVFTAPVSEAIGFVEESIRG